MNHPTQILDTIKVIDLTQALAGPTCSMYLGDMGADVIKIERPGSGDMSRGYGPPFIDGESAYFLSVNRNKRSVAIDYTKPDGLKVFHQLIDDADVFINNLPRQASLEKYGLSAEACLARNPRLIHLSITGFGRTGPYADRSGYDVVAQAMSGHHGPDRRGGPAAAALPSCHCRHHRRTVRADQRAGRAVRRVSGPAAARPSTPACWTASSPG